jgi:pimeloyl-ACP methyl ester carboxylesterase
MPQLSANGITLEYEISGPRDGPPLLLIHGVGAQLIRWPQGFCDRLIAAGFRVLRYDSRDIGLSTHMLDAPIPDLAEVTEARRQGREPELPYTVADLADDAAGLLAALNIAAAHVVGVSLGGMVAQQMAIAHPEQVLSMVSIMSQSGNPELPGSNPAALAKLSAIAPDPASDREGYISHQVSLNRVLGSPAYPAPEETLRQMAALAADRAYYPPGAARQLAAGRGAPDRRLELRRLSLPTLVIHGSDDPLILPVCGQDTADNVPNAWYLQINGMGHDLPEPLFDLVVANIVANCARADPGLGPARAQKEPHGAG